MREKMEKKYGYHKKNISGNSGDSFSRNIDSPFARRV